MLHLQLNVLRHPIPPEPRPIQSGGFAFENLHVTGTHDLPVDIRQHPGIFRVLENRIAAPDLAIRLPSVMLGYKLFQLRAPVERIAIGFFRGCQGVLPAGLVEPQCQGRLIRIQPDGGSGIAAADPLPTHIQPGSPAQGLGVDETQGRAVGRDRTDWRDCW